MKTKNMKLNDLFLMKIMALYDIEKELTKALPKMMRASTSPDLKKALESHFSETKEHVTRLEEVFSMLGEKPAKTKVEGIRGIIKDGEWVIKNVMPESARDANIIRAVQYAEHYEVAGYTGAVAWAKKLNHPDVVEILEETLTEEKSADSGLESLAKAIDRAAQ